MSTCPTEQTEGISTVAFDAVFALNDVGVRFGAEGGRGRHLKRGVDGEPGERGRRPSGVTLTPYIDADVLRTPSLCTGTHEAARRKLPSGDNEGDNSVWL